MDSHVTVPAMDIGSMIQSPKNHFPPTEKSAARDDATFNGLLLQAEARNQTHHEASAKAEIRQTDRAKPTTDDSAAHRSREAAPQDTMTTTTGEQNTDQETSQVSAQDKDSETNSDNTNDTSTSNFPNTDTSDQTAEPVEIHHLGDAQADTADEATSQKENADNVNEDAKIQAETEATGVSKAQGKQADQSATTAQAIPVESPAPQEAAQGKQQGTPAAEEAKDSQGKLGKATTVNDTQGKQGSKQATTPTAQDQPVNTDAVQTSETPEESSDTTETIVAEEPADAKSNEKASAEENAKSNDKAETKVEANAVAQAKNEATVAKDATTQGQETDVAVPVQAHAKNEDNREKLSASKPTSSSSSTDSNSVASTSTVEEHSQSEANNEENADASQETPVTETAPSQDMLEDAPETGFDSSLELAQKADPASTDDAAPIATTTASKEGGDKLGGLDQDVVIARQATDTSLTAKSSSPNIEGSVADSTIREVNAARESSGVKTVEKMANQQAMIDKISTNIRMMVGRDQNTLRVEMTPPDLGKMQIRLSLKNGQLHARMRVESVDARELITKNFDQMRDNLSKQGIEVESFTVDVQTNDQQHGDTFTGQYRWQNQQATRPNQFATVLEDEGLDNTLANDQVMSAERLDLIA